MEQKFSWELIARTDKLLASEDVPYEGFSRLHLVALRYQAAVEAIQTAAHEDAALAYQEPQYKKKLKEQMTTNLKKEEQSPTNIKKNQKPE